MKWAGKPGPDIEIIQRTHRYAVTWPSVVEGRSYQWYDPQGRACDVPDVATFPDLPDSWVDVVFRNAATSSVTPYDFATDDKALGWLARTVCGYDDPVMTPMIGRVVDEITDCLPGGAHDSIVGKLWQIVALAAEGHHGSGAALDVVRGKFLAEVSTRRSEWDALAEWGRSLTGAIGQLRAEIEAGVRVLSRIGITAESLDVDLAAFYEWLTDQRRITPFDDVSEYDPSDSGRADLFNAVTADVVQPVRARNLKRDKEMSSAHQWVYWDSRARRRSLIGEDQTLSLWRLAVSGSYRAAADVLASQLDDIDEDDDRYDEIKEQIEALRRAAVRAGDRTIYRAGLASAHALHEHPVYVEDFDQDKNLAGAPNGVLDLANAAEGSTGLLRDMTPDDLVFRSIRDPFIPEHTDPLWTRYLDTFLPNRRYRRFVRKLFGYAFLGGNPERKLPFLKGGTGSGKSTIAELATVALGDYAEAFDTNDLFRAKRDGGPKPEILALKDCRIIFASELAEANKLHADAFKRVVGNDSISGRALYSNDVGSHTMMFTPIIATNEMPTIENADGALDGRIIVLPFTASPERNSATSSLPDQMKASQSTRQAFVAWLVAGLLDYLDEGLDDLPPEVVEATSAALSELNEFRGWAERQFVKHTGPKRLPISQRVGYDKAWSRWCEDRALGKLPKSLRDLDETEFHKRMRRTYGGHTSRKDDRTLPDGTVEKRVPCDFYGDPIMFREPRKTAAIKSPIVLRANTESE